MGGHPELMLYFNIAAELHCTVGELMVKMKNSAEITYWKAYFKVQNELINQRKHV